MNIKSILKKHDIPKDVEASLIADLEKALDRVILKERRVLAQVVCPYCLAVMSEAAHSNSKGDFSLSVTCPKCMRGLTVQGTRKVFVSKIAEDK
jgi:hypothetical protein